MPEDIDEELTEALQLLAAEPEQQLAAFPDWVQVADELALSYEAAYSRLSERSTLDTAEWNIVRDELVGLNSLLENPAPGEDNPWSDSALRSSGGWRNIREAAKDILLIVGVPVRTPRAQHDRYAGG